MKQDHRPRRLLAGAFVLATAVSTIPIADAAAAPAQRGCERRNNNTYEKLLECVTLEGVLEHEQAFQAIATANGGNRADQSQGYLDSVDYVVETMTAAGWDVEKVPFDYTGLNLVVEQVAPESAQYDSIAALGTGAGDVTAPITPVNVVLEEPRDPVTSGCDPADFAGFPAGNIALVQRGTCNFSDKVVNAENAGATAVIIFNQGNSPDRTDLDLRPDLTPFQAAIPVVFVSYPDGEALAGAETAHVQVEEFDATSYNVIAELPGMTGNVVMAGAHLDGVPDGPGINDNGSGSSVLLEVAQNLANHRPHNTLRFAWWGAEELGLIGSTAWVEQQVEAGTLDEVALYMNFDMVGSPNYIHMVYDADQSTFPAPVPVPPGSEAVEDIFESFYTWKGVPYDDTEFSGRSDYEAFIANGIPSSGLFTGAEERKTEAQAAIWGGMIGEQFDPCYHDVCDTIENLSHEALDVNADAVAFAVLTYAYSTESVNGIRGTRVPGRFEIPAPAGPQGTFDEP